ncbi:hypothetical protein Taro_013030 [Colocasia esculenta]|uniref:Uncharacterized protein n=1 Tax=Colocasia esculenta TaxID=4460 RepID=A0A843UF95_COLES|nr:hypothetical protein [Colocasia esculenta]
MDDYTREMMDLKTLVTRTLEKKGVLAKIRSECAWDEMEMKADPRRVKFPFKWTRVLRYLREMALGHGVPAAGKLCHLQSADSVANETARLIGVLDEGVDKGLEFTLLIIKHRWVVDIARKAKSDVAGKKGISKN